MIKKFGLVSVLVLATTLPTVTLAEETGGGCGVGKVVMEGKTGRDAHLVVAFVNILVAQIFPHQLFGMTSGTLGCDVSQQVFNDHPRETFVAANAGDISAEIARGEGEHLASLASMMGVETDDQAEFYSTLQSHFETIATEDDMLASIDSTLQGNPQLAKYVK